MMCSMLESAAYNIRDTDDLLNPVGAGCLTGVIYKITSVRQPRAPQRLGIRFQPPSAYRILEVGARPVCSSVRLTARMPCFSGPESGDVRGARLGSCGCCRGFCVQADLISRSAEKLYVMHEVLGRRVGVSSATERRVQSPLSSLHFNIQVLLSSAFMKQVYTRTRDSQNPESGEACAALTIFFFLVRETRPTSQNTALLAKSGGVSLNLYDRRPTRVAHFTSCM